jgi:CDP-diacylglycerol---serine O-phosphatidyltransferase
MKNLPNLFTLLNLFFGCIAIIMALQTESIIIFTNEEFTSSFNIPEKLAIAGLLLFAAAIIDFCDGFVARCFKVSSDMGKQLDSLADVVSFGAAPGIIIYQLLRLSFIREENGLDTSLWVLLPALVLPCAAAYRLARFNLDTSQAFGFKGVPTPAAGLFVASLPLILHYGNSFGVGEWLINKWVLYTLTLLLSWLMISNLPLLSLKFKEKSLKANLPKMILAGIAIVSALFFHWLAVPVVFIAYIILSLVLNKQHV